MYNIAVIGASGKMGKGISLLMLEQLSLQEAEEMGAIGTGAFKLILIDQSEEMLHHIEEYLETHLKKFAEKNINTLRRCFEKDMHLISNQEIIDHFLHGAKKILYYETAISSAKDCTLIFEAVTEKIDVKISIFKELEKITKKETLFFTNTSSIPIHILCEKSHLQGRLIGFHFYNPPPVQKLVELIIPKNTSQELIDTAHLLCRRLSKIAVEAKDVAGFIGNGHFLREVHFALDKVEEMDMPLERAIYITDKLTREFLLRPMGIFQLIDYVGVDITQEIASIMEKYLHPIKLKHRLLDIMIQNHRLGGQNRFGKQKEGFFLYDGLHPIAYYSFEKDNYFPLTPEVVADFEKDLDKLPTPELLWKHLQTDKKREDKIDHHISWLIKDTTPSKRLAKQFLKHSCHIAHELVDTGTAASLGDVSIVLKNGFYHLFGPDHPHLKVFEESYEIL